MNVLGSLAMDTFTIYATALLGFTLIMLIWSVTYSLLVPLPDWLADRRERMEEKRIAEEEANLPPEADPPTVLLLPPRGFSIVVTEQVGAADSDPLQPLPSPADSRVRTKGNRRLQAGDIS